MSTEDKYVAAVYLVVFVVLLAYVLIIATKPRFTTAPGTTTPAARSPSPTTSKPSGYPLSHNSHTTASAASISLSQTAIGGGLR